jgi:hypothetical protein
LKATTTLKFARLSWISADRLPRHTRLASFFLLIQGETLLVNIKSRIAGESAAIPRGRFIARRSITAPVIVIGCL